MGHRIDEQIGFLLAADGLKSVQRHNLLFSGSRNENTAEHCWHLTLMAMALAEYAPSGTDIAHVIQLLIVHDLVEVHAGDHWSDGSDAGLVASKEAAAAETLFRLLPDDQAARLHNLWGEFEARQTPEACFAKALDALHPMLLIWGPGGTDYVHTPLTAARMREIKRTALEPFPALWNFAESLLDKAVERGVLPP
ncbi:HD domain-containing protein [Bosea sp. UNC402CLCol]|jgi:putative hydrolase of HD superfamily|uniref:HD domain-containing protein n=1 Tax=Bosea sp. UNC402CLCol TaxID=1510531 RepID=UPI000691E4B2|nr:HD domain-containing protein [Bosea sp. UNC402CLCol]